MSPGWAAAMAPWIEEYWVGTTLVLHSSGIPSPSASRLAPEARSHSSGTPFMLQSTAGPWATSQESGTPLPLQSLSRPWARSQPSS